MYNDSFSDTFDLFKTPYSMKFGEEEEDKLIKRIHEFRAKLGLFDEKTILALTIMYANNFMQLLTRSENPLRFLTKEEAEAKEKEQ